MRFVLYFERGEPYHNCFRVENYNPSDQPLASLVVELRRANFGWVLNHPFDDGLYFKTNQK